MPATVVARPARPRTADGGRISSAPPARAPSCSAGLTLRMTLRNLALGVDHKGRALVAEVRFPIHRLLSPDAVSICDCMALIGKQAKVQRLLVVEFLDLRNRVGGDSQHDGALGGVVGLGGRARRTPGWCSRACPPWDRSRRRPGLPRSAESFTGPPSWSGSSKSGACVPGSIIVAILVAGGRAGPPSPQQPREPAVLEQPPARLTRRAVGDHVVLEVHRP